MKYANKFYAAGLVNRLKTFMKSAALVFIPILLLSAGTVSAGVWYVKPDSTGQVINIQAGIDSCEAGDTVLVSPGVFRGDGNRDLDFRGKPILVISECRFDTTITDSTVIDCEWAPTDLHRGFYFHSGEANSSILEGFIIENGFAHHPGGGGILCDSASSPTIRYNTFKYCNANDGGAICCRSSSPVIDSNEMYDDRETKCNHGAIYCHSSSAIIINNEIHDYGAYLGGGGIFCDSCYHMTIENNDIYNNVHAGIYLHYSHAIIHDNRIRNNMGGDRTTDAIECYKSNVIITNNEIYGNPTLLLNSLCGKISPVNVVIGLYDSRAVLDSNYVVDNYSKASDDYTISILSDSAIVVSNNVISGNSGSGIRCRDSDSLKIINNTIVNNCTRYSFGDGISCYSSSGIINNNIVAGNNNGGGIRSESSSVTICCNDVYDNGKGNYTGIPDQTGINGNISVDPIFCYPDNDIYTLHAQSPCVPGNHPDGVGCGLIGALGVDCEYIATLLQGFHASVDESVITITWIMVDCDENTEFYILRSELPDGDCIALGNSHIMREALSFIFYDRDCEPGATYRYRIDIKDEDRLRLLFETDPVTTPVLPLALFQNYPNPFNPSTMIKFYLPEKSLIYLGVYNVSGGLVACLENGEREKGVHTVQWRGADRYGTPVASGVYFYRLVVGKERLSRKLILLR